MCCNRDMKRKYTIVLCIVIYAFMCLFGNIITGIFIYRHRHMEEDDESVAETILSSLDSSVDYNLDFENNTFALDDFIGQLEEETTELYNLLGSISTDNENIINQSESVCYEFINDYNEIRTSVKYWIEGVAILTVGIVGLIGNILSIIILQMIKPVQRFNKLLIVFAVIDSLLIIDTCVQKSIVPYFTITSPIEPLWYKLSFPYFWHPFKGIIRTITIYMMVLISCDRFRAVCYPFHRKYSTAICVVVVVAFSVVLKVPMFFQFRVVTVASVQEYWTTSIMDSPEYLSFHFYWEELFATGILPLAIIVFLNTRIYLKIRTSAKWKCNRFVGSRFEEDSLITRTKSVDSPSERNHESSKNDFQSSSIDAIGSITDNALDNKDHMKLERNSSTETNNSYMIVEDCNQKQTVVRQDSRSHNITNKLSTVREEYQTLECFGKINNRSEDMDPNSSYHNVNQSFPSTKSSHLHRRPQRSTSTHLKMSTYKSATILISMVILFLLTHFYRVTLKIYEITTPKNNMKDFTFCMSKDRYHVPVTLYILSNINNLFLVINSSINFLIYYLMGKEFRKQTTNLLKEISKRLKLICNSNHH